nr:integrator complex subunit 14 [Ciona intestinalis]|eukprot:XP_004226337.1 integrator complex subunit 14 [Ciona intestinalis]
MPVIVAVDASLSMWRNVFEGEEKKTTRFNIAEECTNQILDHVTSKFKLESMALLSCSSSVTVLSDFTRDLSMLKNGLKALKIGDKADFSSFVNYLNHFVVKTWGRMQSCTVIVITDGGIVSVESLDALKNAQTKNSLFEFPCNLHFLCIETLQNLKLSGSYYLLHEILKINEDLGSVVPLLETKTPEMGLPGMVATSIDKFLNNTLKTFETTLSCGNLSSRISIFPSPKAQKSINSSLEAEIFTVKDKISIVGFLNISDIRNPPVLSRHLLLPITPTEVEDISTHPSFSVVLHGSLKMESKVALVKLATEWFGIIYSWADSKTKSNLVLSILPVGLNCIPWLGNFNQLAPASMWPESLSSKKPSIPSFPVQSKRFMKRSYSQPTVAWTRATGLQTDVQKILRSAKKLPEKSHVFYKDLNRLRRAALSFGFHDLLDGISALLERECTLLPGTAHPEATLQLSHAARELKSTINKGHEHTIEPLKTDFKFQGLK